MSTTTDLATVIRTVADRVGPAVVAIGRHGRGTGVVIAPGQVLTNAHNLRDRTTQVTFAGGRAVQGAVAGADPDGDLVVLAVDTADVTPVELAPLDTPAQLGDTVVALARGPMGGLRATAGTVSGTDRSFRGPSGRRIAGSIEHTAPMGRGSSGGPLLDHEGRLVGVNTNRVGEGFYLARPADADLRERIGLLASGTSVTPRRLGVALAPAHIATRLRRAVGLPEVEGLLVRGVEPGSPAAAAGLREGDLITHAGGAAVGTADDLFAALQAVGPDQRVTLTVLRGAEERTVEVSFDPSAPPATDTGDAGSAEATEA